MSFNKALSRTFEQIAQMLELLGEDRFRVNAHARAARVISDQTADLSTLDRKQLMQIEGIGAKVADKIIEFAGRGRIAEHQELLGRVPAGVLDLLEIQGLGPKKVKLIWDELGVTDLEALQRAAAEGTLAKLRGMGAKTVENILRSIEFARSSGERLPLGRAVPVAERIVDMLRGIGGVTQAEFAGSARRGRDTVGDIDILVATADPGSAAEAFCTMPGVRQVLARGKTKSSVRLSVGDESIPWREPDADRAPAVQVDLRIVPEESWGAALAYFTGSKEHNVRMRELAIKRGLTLNEYGLFPADDEDSPPQSRGVESVAGATEEEIYAKLELAWVPPEVREDRGELTVEETPRLIVTGDIKAELHAHTTASDGKMSLEELVAEAKRRGFHTIAVTDHSKSSAIANGLDEKRLREQIRRVRELNERVKGITVLAGSEVDIHGDGRLDYDDELLAELDIVVASPHWSLTQRPAEATARLLKVIEHPLVHILGHPTGRLIGRRPGLEPAIDELVAAAAEHRTALEINAHWMRLDLRDVHVRAAVEAGALLAINCDTHAPEDMDCLRFGVATARRGWLTPERCVNSWTAGKVRKWLGDKGNGTK